jgi:cobalt-zinc-cadmium efflux system membrane fusion protein
MATTGGTSGSPSAGGDATQKRVAARSSAGPSVWRRLVQNAINWIVLGGIIVGVFFFLRAREKQKAAVPEQTEVPPVRLAANAPDTLELVPQTRDAMGVQVAEVKASPRTAPLKLFGWLYLEGSRLAHVQTVFIGRAVEVGQTVENGQTRALQPGDKVEEKQILAKLWSKEIGEKKSDLVDALSKLRWHENTLQRLNASIGAVPRKDVFEAQQNIRSDTIEIERLRRTLRSWQIPDDELAAIETEAERIIAKSQSTQVQQTAAAMTDFAVGPSFKPSEQMALDRTWAELDIVSPMTGVILEKNFTVGDNIFPEPTQDMFKIADLSRLGVMAHVYEEDLPKLVALPPDERRWKVELLAEPGVPPRDGSFERIGNVIDINQHTAIVKGWLDNPDGKLRVGQFVSATIELPNPTGLVMVPLSSLIDDGSRTYMFFATDETKTRFKVREVKVARRGAMMALLESQPAADTSREAKPQPVMVGEPVVTSGAMELFSALHKPDTPQAAVPVSTEPRQ